MTKEVTLLSAHSGAAISSDFEQKETRLWGGVIPQKPTQGRLYQDMTKITWILCEIAGVIWCQVGLTK